MTNQDLLGKYPPTAREGMLEIIVNMAFDDHGLGGFEPVEDQNGNPNYICYLNCGRRLLGV